MKLQESDNNHLSRNLNYLLMLRIIAMTTQILALGFMYFSFKLPIPLLPILVLIMVLSLYTAFWWQKHKNDGSIRTRDFMTQLIVDIFALSLLIYFTGGSTNPFIFFFLLPITFAAATLRFKQTCIIATLAAVSYTLLMFFHVPLLSHSGHHDGFDLHVWGMWYGFLISAGLVTYYVSQVGATVRHHNKALAIAREENLRAEQVLSLGTLAAGTAHELGTPLSTMAILAKELEYEHQQEPETIANLEVLRQQIDRCKSILSKMAIDAGAAHAESGEARLIHEYLIELIDEWQLLRPETSLSIDIDPSLPEIEIIADRTLGQSILNVLSNAADAAEENVGFKAHWDQTSLEIEICDDGGGIDDALIAALGKPVPSEKKPGGMGIGLFLAQITLNRLGGTLQLEQGKEKGTQAMIKLPLTDLQMKEHPNG